MVQKRIKFKSFKLAKKKEKITLNNLLSSLTLEEEHPQFFINREMRRKKD